MTNVMLVKACKNNKYNFEIHLVLRGTKDKVDFCFSREFLNYHWSDG